MCFVAASAETPSESGSDFGIFPRGQLEDGDAIPAADKANYYKEKLKALQYKAGLGLDDPVDNRVDDFNRNQQREVQFYFII